MTRRQHMLERIPAFIQYIAICAMAAVSGFCFFLCLFRRAWQEDMAVDDAHVAWGVFTVAVISYLVSSMTAIWTKNHPRCPHWLDRTVRPLQLGIGAIAFVCVAWWFLG